MVSSGPMYQYVTKDYRLAQSSTHDPFAPHCINTIFVDQSTRSFNYFFVLAK